MGAEPASRSSSCLGSWQWVVMSPPTWLVLCGAILLQVGYGFYPVLLKRFSTSTDPVVFSFYRNLFCFPLLLGSALIVRRQLILPDLKMTLVFAVLGLTGIFGSQLLYIFGVYLVGPDISSAFQPVIPVWTTVLAVVTCTEKFPSLLRLHSWTKLLGIAMATGGAIELILTGTDRKSYLESPTFSASDDNFTMTSSAAPPLGHHHSVSLHNMLGYMALIGNTFCTAVGLLLQKRYVFNIPDSKWRHLPIYVTAYSIFFGALFKGMASFYYVMSGQYSKYRVPDTSVYALLYAVFISSAACSLLLTWANMHLPTTVITAIWPTQVLVAVVGSYFVTGDELAPYQYIGAVMLILALFLVLFSNHVEEKSKEKKLKLRKEAGNAAMAPLLRNGIVRA